MKKINNFKLLILTVSVFFLSFQALGKDNPCRPNPHSPDCVGSIYDPYKNWKPAPMHSPKEMLRILGEGVHICELTDRGPCDFDRAGHLEEPEWFDMGKDSHNGIDFQ